MAEQHDERQVPNQTDAPAGRTGFRQDGITIVLRVAGVLTIFIGLILTTHVVVQLIAAHSAMSGFPGGQLPQGMTVNIKGAAGRAGNWAIFGQVTTSLWGGLLVALARRIAEGVARV